MLFDGTGDWVDCDGDTAFAFGTGDFTVEFIVRVTALPGATVCLYSSNPAGTGGFYLSIAMNTTGNILVRTNGATILTSSVPIAINNGYAVAVNRTAAVTRVYISGADYGNVADTNNYLNGTSRPRIGADGNTGGENFAGKLDELRVTKGFGRYPAAYTPVIARWDDWGLPVVKAGVHPKRNNVKTTNLPFNHIGI